MRSYQKIPGDHRKEIQDIWEGYLIVEEKVDGSQFRVEIDEKGMIYCGSHHQELNLTDNQFKQAIDEAQKVFAGIKSDPNDIISIFCEYLRKPKHNVIPYERVPNHNLAVFDVLIGGKFLDRESKERFVFNVGLEVVPMLWRGEAKDFTDKVKNKLLETKSFLGHQKGYDRIEGIVIKNYNKYYDVNKYPWLEGTPMFTKIVNDDFKEKNKVSHPKAGDKIETLKKSICTEARWIKAVQHCKERNELVGDMVDLQKLAPEIVRDLVEEEKEGLKEELWKLYGKQLTQASVKGLPQWYKERLKNGLS